MWTHRTIIVPTSAAEFARTACARLAGPGGSGMFTTPLSTTGEAPPTHYISSGLIEPEFAHMLPEQVWEQDEDGAWVQTGSTQGDPVAVYEACTAAGMVVTQAEVDGGLAVADVTKHEPFVALGRRGLVLVQPNTEP